MDDAGKHSVVGGRIISMLHTDLPFKEWFGTYIAKALPIDFKPDVSTRFGTYGDINGRHWATTVI